MEDRRPPNRPNFKLSLDNLPADKKEEKWNVTAIMLLNDLNNLDQPWESNERKFIGTLQQIYSCEHGNVTKNAVDIFGDKFLKHIRNLLQALNAPGTTFGEWITMHLQATIDLLKSKGVSIDKDVIQANLNAGGDEKWKNLINHFLIPILNRISQLSMNSEHKEST